MKVVIFAGGYGTRLSEETDVRPKPMVEIGGKPILWHIMKIYSSHGFNEFIICTGYKGYTIKEYFHHYFLHQADVTFDMVKNEAVYHNSGSEPWTVTLVDTGLETMTGGRLARVKPYLDGGTFMLTYGDGVSDVDIPGLLAFHKAHGKLATLTSVQPGGKFGALEIGTGDIIHNFHEKPKGDGAWINGGFFVLESKVLEYIHDGDKTIWERGPLEGLARDGQLHAFKHTGFWRPMDTLKDKMDLEALWTSGQAPWKKWK